MFIDRQQAGQLLAEKLSKYQNAKNTLVLAIPRGGVVVAKEIAKALKLPLDVIITRKIGSPAQKELAIGSINPNGQVIWDQKYIQEFDLTSEQLQQLKDQEFEEIKRHELVYRTKKPPLNIEGKTVILVDDGIATGLTTHSAIDYLCALNPQKIILAVPVADSDSLVEITPKVDEVIILEKADFLQSVGSFYQEFSPISDQEVIQLLSD